VVALDPAALGARAVDKAKKSLGAVAIEPGRYTVVLEPTAVGNLLQLLTGAMNARGADEGRSFFSKAGGGNKLGEKVVDERVTIVSDPYDPDSYGAPFTGEGLPTKRVVWIENGVVKNLNYDRFWARKQGKEPTGAGGGGGFGGGGGGLKMMGGNESLESLIAGCQRGLLGHSVLVHPRRGPAERPLHRLTRDGTFSSRTARSPSRSRISGFNESPVIMLNKHHGDGQAGAGLRE
jgi:predicted Zn-dependent protease